MLPGDRQTADEPSARWTWLPHLKLLYAFLRESGLLRAIEKVDESQPHIFPGDVQALIAEGNPVWEEMVPAEVARIVKEQALFGHRPIPAPS